MSGWGEVLAELVSYRGTELKRYGFLLCGDQASAADLVQEALVRAFSRPRTGWNVEGAERYVRQAMLNCFLDQRRRHQRWRLLRPRLVESDISPDISTQTADRIDVKGLLASLPPRQRACVVLRYYEDLQVTEIAERLGCHEGTVKRHLNSAHARLGAALLPLT